MDLGSIFLILGLAILTFIFILRPLFEMNPDRKLITRSVPVSEDDQKRSVLLAERDRLLRALQELDFDNALGKIPEEDYPEERKSLMLKSAAVLKSLDEMNATVSTESVEERIETEIALRRADAAKPARSLGKDPDIESLISSRRRSRSEKPAGFCPKCGKPVSASDKFCAKCGTTL